jgi:hypothetical protein
MIPDLDIRRAAQVMVKRYGDDAGTQVAMRADQLGAEGEPDGAATWQRIMKATERLQAQKPAEGEEVH